MPSDPTPTLPAPPPAPLLLKPKDAARALAISDRKMWSLTTGGDIPHVRIGRAVRYRPESLRAWLARQEEGRR